MRLICFPKRARIPVQLMSVPFTKRDLVGTFPTDPPHILMATLTFPIILKLTKKFREVENCANHTWWDAETGETDGEAVACGCVEIGDGRVEEMWYDGPGRSRPAAGSSGGSIQLQRWRQAAIFQNHPIVQAAR